MNSTTAMPELCSGKLSDEPTPPPQWLRGSRIPCLDGLRALSIILVTISHILPARGSPWEQWKGIAAWGDYGVDVFFVISGFLITHLLLREDERSGTISLRGFYVRRTIRIVPAYLLLICIALVLSRAGFFALKLEVWIGALTYTLNLLPGRGGEPIGQVWSLCVEEHFYLVWPLTLVFLGRRWAPMVLLATILSAPVLRFVLWERYHGWVNIDELTPTRIDTIAIGCLLAFVAHHPRSWPFMNLLAGRGAWVAIVAFGVFCFSAVVLSESGKYALGPRAAVEATAVAVIIIALVNDPFSHLGRLLNTRLLVSIGVLSYSLYLGQTFADPGHWHNWPLSWAWNFPLIVCYALISYCLIERPFLYLKERMSSGSQTVAHR